MHHLYPMIFYHLSDAFILSILQQKQALRSSSVGLRVRSIHRTLQLAAALPRPSAFQGLFGRLMNNSERLYPNDFGIFMTIFGQRAEPNHPEVAVTSHQQTSETSGENGGGSAQFLFIFCSVLSPLPLRSLVFIYLFI